MPRYRLGLGEWSLSGFIPAGTEVERATAPFGSVLLSSVPKLPEKEDEEADSIVDVDTTVVVKKGK